MNAGQLGTFAAAILEALSVAMGDFPEFAEEGRVRRGRYRIDKPPRIPFIGIAAAATVSTQEGVTFGQKENRPAIDIIGWGHCESSDPHDRTIAGEALAHQMVQALDQARRDPTSALYTGGLRSFTVQSTVIDGDIEPVPPGATVVVLVCQLAYKTQEGL